MKSKTINKLIFSALLLVFGAVSTNAQSKENRPSKTPPTAKEFLKCELSRKGLLSATQNA